MSLPRRFKNTRKRHSVGRPFHYAAGLGFGKKKEKSKQNRKISGILFGGFGGKVYFCRRKRLKIRIMSKMNVWFYGYYFYFAENCEAGSCV